MHDKQQTEESNNKQEKYLIKSVIKALDILEEMAEQNGEVRVKDLVHCIVFFLP